MINWFCFHILLSGHKKLNEAHPIISHKFLTVQCINNNTIFKQLTWSALGSDILYSFPRCRNWGSEAKQNAQINSIRIIWSGFLCQLSLPLKVITILTMSSIFNSDSIFVQKSKLQIVFYMNYDCNMISGERLVHYCIYHPSASLWYRCPFRTVISFQATGDICHLFQGPSTGGNVPKGPTLRKPIHLKKDFPAMSACADVVLHSHCEFWEATSIVESILQKVLCTSSDLWNVWWP